jgi:hypothetical protein
LAGLEAGAGDRLSALRMIQEVVSNRPDLTRAGGIEVGLLRAVERKAEATKRLAFWKRQDPTSSFLRYEGIRLGQSDPGLMAHLAADPERILRSLPITCASAFMRTRSMCSRGSIPQAQTSSVNPERFILAHTP